MKRPRLEQYDQVTGSSSSVLGGEEELVSSWEAPPFTSSRLVVREGSVEGGLGGGAVEGVTVEGGLGGVTVQLQSSAGERGMMESVDLQSPPSAHSPSSSIELVSLSSSGVGLATGPPSEGGVSPSVEVGTCADLGMVSSRLIFSRCVISRPGRSQGLLYK